MFLEDITMSYELTDVSMSSSAKGLTSSRYQLNKKAMSVSERRYLIKKYL
jgi:hypothetical protein